MSGTADGAGDRGEMPDSESTRDTAVHPESVARAVRRAAILAGLVPLADLTDREVAWVFNKLVGD
jgi:hypothetical protein